MRQECGSECDDVFRVEALWLKVSGGLLCYHYGGVRYVQNGGY